MKFSAQEEYGLRCLLHVGKLGTATIPEISKAEGLSQANVAKLLRILKRGGFVKASRGQIGGYSLSKPLDEIAVGDVLALLGGRLYDESFCGKHKGKALSCTHTIDCSLRSLWSEIQFAVDNIVKDVTLQDLVPKSEQPITISVRSRV